MSIEESALRDRKGLEAIIHVALRNGIQGFQHINSCRFRLVLYLYKTINRNAKYLIQDF